MCHHRLWPGTRMSMCCSEPLGQRSLTKSSITRTNWTISYLDPVHHKHHLQIFEIRHGQDVYHVTKLLWLLINLLQLIFDQITAKYDFCRQFYGAEVLRLFQAVRTVRLRDSSQATEDGTFHGKPTQFDTSKYFYVFVSGTQLLWWQLQQIIIICVQQLIIFVTCLNTFPRSS